MLYQKFLVGEKDHFVSGSYPTIDSSLQQIAEQLSKHPGKPMAEMVISFAKDHCMRSQLVNEYPSLAALISSGTLPLDHLEALFAASKQNRFYTGQLETYALKKLNPSTND